MKTKIIPFDLETAKKIQAGEIEGKIKYSESDGYAYNAEIIKFDLIADKSKAKPNSTLFRTIVAVVDFDDYQGVRTFNTDGYGCNHSGDDTKLFIEVPDNEPQFNSLYSIERLNKLKEYTEQLMEVNQGLIDDLYSTMHKIRKTCNLSLKTEFKPFDKVLVRSKDNTNNRWLPAIYAYYDDVVSHVTIDHRMYAEEDCIPYEGNEHLVGTSNSQDED